MPFARRCATAARVAIAQVGAQRASVDCVRAQPGAPPKRLGLLGNKKAHVEIDVGDMSDISANAAYYDETEENKAFDNVRGQGSRVIVDEDGESMTSAVEGWRAGERRQQW